MNTNRDWVPCVFVLGSHLYVAGGRDMGMEHINIHDNTSAWTPSISPPHKVRYTSCVILKSIVILAGGSNGTSQLTSVITWKQGDTKWSSLPTMQQKRAIFCMVSDGVRYVYVVGGSASGRRLNSIERFDSQTNTWKDLRPMPLALQNHKCVYLNDIIYVTGGHNGTAKVNTIYLYKVTSDIWIKSTTLLQEPVSGHAMVQSITP